MTAYQIKVLQGCDTQPCGLRDSASSVGTNCLDWFGEMGDNCGRPVVECMWRELRRALAATRTGLHAAKGEGEVSRTFAGCELEKGSPIVLLMK